MVFTPSVLQLLCAEKRQLQYCQSVHSISCHTADFMTAQDDAPLNKSPSKKSSLDKWCIPRSAPNFPKASDLCSLAVASSRWNSYLPGSPSSCSKNPFQCLELSFGTFHESVKYHTARSIQEIHPHPHRCTIKIAGCNPGLRVKPINFTGRWDQVGVHKSTAAYLKAKPGFLLVGSMKKCPPWSKTKLSRHDSDESTL